RDGRNVGVLARSEINHAQMVRMMVGRDLKEFFKSGPDQRPESDQPEWFSVRELRTSRYPHHHVSFSVGRGEVLGIAGLVGAGRLEGAGPLFGIDGTTANITLGGQELRINTPHDAIRKGIYLVPEDRRQSGLIVDFNVRENISLPGMEHYSRAGMI